MEEKGDEAAETAQATILRLPVGVPPAYDPRVAGKKIAWAAAKYTLARGITPTVLPAVVAVFDKVASALKPVGIGLTVDRPVFEAALPMMVFAALVCAHDAIKVKTGTTWM